MTVVINGTTGITSPADSLSGNLTFTGTGNRITGDFSNATVASRVSFQTSTVNGNTSVIAIPNGTAVNSSFGAFNNSDPTNAAYGGVGVVGSTDVRLTSGITGTGTYLPMTFYTGGTESLRLSETSKAVILSGGSTSANGTGITFPATQSASTDANTLDDYEEGTFSPTFAATGCTFNYSYQAGAYTKVGRMVTVMIAIGLLGTGNSFNGNTLTISNLPFPVLAGSLYWNNFPVNFQSLSTSVYNVLGKGSSTTVIDLFKITAAATSPTFMVANDLNPTSGQCVIYLCATYST